MAQKSIHVLTHFQQEICGTCDQNLICIGENFYVLHGTITCIPRNIKTETPSCEPNIEHEMDENSVHVHTEQFIDDLKAEAEYENIDQHYTLTQDDCLDADDSERNDDMPIREQNAEDYCFVENSAHENICGDAQLSSCTTEIEKANANVVKSYRKLKGKNTRYECIECKKIFTRTDHLKVHVLDKHRPSEKPFECIECRQRFATNYRLNDHKKYRAICNTCGKIFCTKKQQLLHQAEEHDYNETIAKSSICHYNGCNEIVADCGWTEHMANKHAISREERKRNQYECDICSKTYKTRDGIEFHILSIHCPSSKRFKCKICGYATVSQKLLARHQTKIHFQQRNFMCSVCGKTFRSNYQLKSHGYQHTGEKPYPCLFEGCSKNFRGQPQRIEHMRMHTGQRPFKCQAENCDRSFAYNIDLKRHKFSAHGIYTKKYPCEICTEIFPENMLLKKHMRKHGNNF